MAEIKVAMISSTVRDLPEHREKVRDACLRQGVMPSMMEYWPSLDADGIAASLKKVDQADIYIGVFAHRYGYVPKGGNSSVTEMEYDRAVERDIPRLIFLMDEDHSLKISEIEIEPADKLLKLKDRLKQERTAAFFKSPDDLSAKVIHSLSPYAASASGAGPLSAKPSSVSAPIADEAFDGTDRVVLNVGLIPRRMVCCFATDVKPFVGNNGHQGRYATVAVMIWDPHWFGRVSVRNH